ERIIERFVEGLDFINLKFERIVCFFGFLKGYEYRHVADVHRDLRKVPFLPTVRKKGHQLLAWRPVDSISLRSIETPSHPGAVVSRQLVPVGALQALHELAALWPGHPGGPDFGNRILKTVGDECVGHPV